MSAVMTRGAKIGRPRKHKSGVARQKAYRDAHELVKVTVDVPGRTAPELRSHAKYLRKTWQRLDLQWIEIGRSKTLTIDVLEGTSFKASISVPARGSNVRWNCLAQEVVGSTPGPKGTRTNPLKRPLLEARGESPDLELATTIVESIARLCVAALIEGQSRRRYRGIYRVDTG